MSNLLKFYSDLGFKINESGEKFFTGKLSNQSNTDLIVIHTGEIHRLYIENNGMFCHIIPNSKIDFNNVNLVIEFLLVSVFFKSNFPNIYQKIP